jgi:hypothetical protein
MDELFRFVVLRPPQQGDAIVLTDDSALHSSLVDAHDASDPHAAMQNVAGMFMQSEDFVSDPSALSTPLVAVADTLEQTTAKSRDALEKAVTNALGQQPKAVAQSDAFRADRHRLADSLLALKVSGPDGVDADAILRATRAADVVERLAANDTELDGSAAAKQAMRRLVALPPDLLDVPVTPAVTPPPPTDGSAEKEAKEQKRLAQRAAHIIAALQAIDVASEDTELHPVFADRAVTERARAQAATDFPPSEIRAGAAERATRLPAAPVTAEPGSLVLAERGAAQLAAPVRETLQHLGLDPAATPVPTIVRTLHTELGLATRKVSDFGKVVGAFTHSRFDPVTEPAPHDDATDPSPAVLADPPHSHGTVKPAGVADLLVTRQHVLRYEPGEVSLVEGIAKGEKVTRTTRRAETQEQTVVTETETTSEQERDQQSTDRFDLQRESNDVITTDSQRLPGGPSSSSYGVLVETGGSKTHAQREAETFGRDVTTRAVNKITERNRTQTTQRTVHEFSEEVVREFDNTAGAAESFVYQWLDKVVRAQVFSYGTRLFYDLVVPEPSAFLLRAIAKRTALPSPLVKPARFTLEPDQLDEYNWQYYVAGYGATGVEPPPDWRVWIAPTPFKNVAQDMSSPQAAQDEITQADGQLLKVPDGYQAMKTTVRLDGNHWPDEYTQFGVVVGTRRLDFGDGQPWRQTLALDGEVGNIPVTIATSQSFFFFSVAISVMCERTERALDEWRQRTYEAIRSAADQRMAEYEQRFANYQAAVRMQALSQPAARKQAIEREELQRSALEVLTNQHFDGLSAIEHSPQGYPQPFLPNIEPLGRYVRFLQQAFEWEQMTWRHYPYFWGRKDYWIDKALLDDADDEFRDFLRAGSARVLLPVRPGFEGAVTHFMETGDVPTSDALTQMASPLYVPLLTETIDDGVEIQAGVPYGEPWDVRIPTTLVKMRADATLPTWTAKKTAQGEMAWSAGPAEPL